MKTKTLKLTAILLIFVGAFTACNEKEPPIELFLNVETTSITASAEGGVFHIAVSSNGEWTAVVQDAENHLWLTMTDALGTNDGVITVNIAENPYFETRSATIKISMGDLSEYVFVKQEASEEEKPCEDCPREISFTRYFIPWQCIGNFNAGEYYIVINCKEGLERHIINCFGWHPEIDFSKHSLLLVRGMGDIFYSPTPKSLRQTSAQNFVMELTLLPTVVPNITEWRMAVLIDKIPDNMNIEFKAVKYTPEHSVWRTEQGSSYIELTFYPSINKVQVQTYPNPLPPMNAPFRRFFGRTVLMDYYIEDDRMHFPVIIGASPPYFRTIDWIISYPDENEMALRYAGVQLGWWFRVYNFMLQTEFREK